MFSFDSFLQDIYGMVSVDEEDVPFSTIIYPADAKGMVSYTIYDLLLVYKIIVLDIFFPIYYLDILFTSRLKSGYFKLKSK